MAASIISDLARIANRFPQRTAVRIGGQTTTYGDLYERASAVARTILDAPGSDGPLVAVVANRTASAFAGVAGTLLAGKAYVPINPSSPPARIRSMLESTGCRTMIAEPGALPVLTEALDGREDPLCVIIPEDGAGRAAFHLPARLRVVTSGQLTPGDPVQPPPVSPDDLAYVMFTSGSTGTPKGVMTTHGNIRWVLDVLQERYGITADDRLSLNAEMTFSASVLVIFLAFGGGASICCPTRRELLTPARFIIDEGITVWKCVPSLAVLMDRTHQLQANTFPTIRITTFGGEPVPVDIVERWAAAAPHTVIENVYGSTETSINALYFPWDPVYPERDVYRRTIPIGAPLRDVIMLVCDEELKEVGTGETGELLVSGPLVTRGYWGDEERTRAAYVIPPGRSGTYYRTGDIVRRPAEGGPVIFIGRRDNQIKVLGNRVELGEIEAVARECLGLREVVALGWPPSTRGFDGIELFLGEAAQPEHEIFRILKEHLAAYMMPRRIRLLERLPLNPSGKIDRIALKTILESERA